MKLKKILAYSGGRQIWRILISDSDKLLIEERDINRKEAFFSLFDIRKGKKIWKDFQLDEKFWIGVEDIYKDVIIFHKFGKPDMPSHKELIAVGLEDKKPLWKSEQYEFLFIYDDRIYCRIKGFEKHNFVTLDYMTGAVTEELGDDYLKVNEFKALADRTDKFRGYLYAEDKNFVALSDGAKVIIETVCSKYEVEGKTEVIETDGVLLFNFHYKNSSGLFTNIFFAFNTLPAKQIMSDTLTESANAFVPDSFFVRDGFLFLLKEKNSICIYLLKK
jgi:hypothetical protein